MFRRREPDRAASLVTYCETQASAVANPCEHIADSVPSWSGGNSQSGTIQNNLICAPGLARSGKPPARALGRARLWNIIAFRTVNDVLSGPPGADAVSGAAKLIKGGPATERSRSGSGCADVGEPGGGCCRPTGTHVERPCCLRLREPGLIYILKFAGLLLKNGAFVITVGQIDA